MMCVGMIVDFGGLAVGPILRSLVTKIVEPGEIGIQKFDGYLTVFFTQNLFLNFRNRFLIASFLRNPDKFGGSDR
jgi:hypothetical protein